MVFRVRHSVNTAVVFSIVALTLRQAYKRLALEHHPDKGGDKERFISINAAYEVRQGNPSSAVVLSGG